MLIYKHELHVALLEYILIANSYNKMTKTACKLRFIHLSILFCMQLTNFLTLRTESHIKSLTFCLIFGLCSDIRISKGKAFKYWTQYQQLHPYISLAVEIKKLLPSVLPTCSFLHTLWNHLKHFTYFAGQKIIKAQLTLKGQKPVKCILCVFPNE